MSPAFRQRLSAAFAEVHPGDRFTYRRTLTEGDLAVFCGVTGDFNPLHQDELLMRESWFGGRIVPGLLTASLVTHIGGLLGFVAQEMRFEFLEGVYVGDTITCTLEVVEKDERGRRLGCEATYTDQRGRLVARAWVWGFPISLRLRRERG